MTDEDANGDVDGPLEALVAIIAVATLPAGILAAVFMDPGTAGIVFVVGWLLLVPVLAILSDYVDPKLTSSGAKSASASESETEDDALQRLRERYAAGEIDEAEFERRVERLIETEGVDVTGGDADLEGLIASDERKGTPKDASKQEGERERDVERE